MSAQVVDDDVKLLREIAGPNRLSTALLSG
jgi:hypothetical protein